MSNTLNLVNLTRIKDLPTSQGGGLPKFGMKGIFYPGFRVNVANSGVAPFRKGGLSDPYVTN